MAMLNNQMVVEKARTSNPRFFSLAEICRNPYSTGNQKYGFQMCPENHQTKPNHRSPIWNIVNHPEVFFITISVEIFDEIIFFSLYPI